jgi:hypothetical protein
VRARARARAPVIDTLDALIALAFDLVLPLMFLIAIAVTVLVGLLYAAAWLTARLRPRPGTGRHRAPRGEKRP